MTVDLDSYAEGAILLDGFEEAIIGIAQEFGNGRRIVYSRHKIIQILCEKHAVYIEELKDYSKNAEEHLLIQNKIKKINELGLLLQKKEYHDEIIYLMNILS